MITGSVMTEENQENTEESGQHTGRYEIQKIYIKDMSFETPNSPEIFRVPWQPEVEQQLGNRSIKISDDVYEIVLSMTLTVRVDDKTAYLVEVHQAGIFTISGYPEDRLEGLISSYSPKMLFPFLRETISDIVMRGGFPQMLLPPIDFDRLYMEYKKQKESSETAEGSDEMH